MGDQSMDEAMVVIQEASSAIVKVSQQLNGLEGKHGEVVQALKDLSNRISNLESKTPQQKAAAIKVPLYIKVTHRASYTFLGVLGSLSDHTGLDY